MAARIGKMQARLQKQLDAKEYYEAGQTYRTLYHRMRGSGQKKEAADLVYSGALELAKNKEFGAAQDLGLLMVDAFKSDSCEKTDETIDRVLNVYKAFAEDERKTKFMGAAFEWARSAAGEGNSLMHLACATQQHKEAKFRESNSHFYHCQDIGRKEYASMLSDWAAADHALGTHHVAEAILSVISEYGVDAGEDLWNRSVEKLKESNEVATTAPPFDFPIYNFVAYVIETLKREAAPLFQLLKDKYKPVLDAHPPLSKVLETLGSKYFDIQPSQPQGLGGLLGSLMTMVEGAMQQGSAQPPAPTATQPAVAVPAAPTATTMQFNADDLDLD